MVVYQNWKIELPYDTAVPLLCIFLKETKTCIWRGICTSMLIAALFMVAEIRKQPKYPSKDKWVKKMQCVCVCVCVYNGICLSYIKEWNLAFMITWMDLEGIMLRERSQRKTNGIWFHLYVETKKQGKNPQTEQVHRHREQTGGWLKGWGWVMGEWTKLMKGIMNYNLLVIQ